jgi:hypothetical protein
LVSHADTMGIALTVRRLEKHNEFYRTLIVRRHGVWLSIAIIAAVPIIHAGQRKVNLQSNGIVLVILRILPVYLYLSIVEAMDTE